MRNMRCSRSDADVADDSDGKRDARIVGFANDEATAERFARRGRGREGGEVNGE